MRRVVRTVGWRLAKRLIRPIPIVGTVVALGLAGYEIRKKGVLRGLVHVGLNATPIVGTVKGAIEIFSGDLIRDKENRLRRDGRVSSLTVRDKQQAALGARQRHCFML